MQAVVVAVVATEETLAAEEAVAATEEIQVHRAKVVVIEETLVVAHVMAHQEKVADTKAIVTVLLEAETLVLHVLQAVSEVKAVTLLPKKVQALEVRAEHPVHHAQMLQEHQEVTPQELLVVKVQQAVLLNLHLETLTKKTNL